MKHIINITPITLIVPKNSEMTCVKLGISWNGLSRDTYNWTLHAGIDLELVRATKERVTFIHDLNEFTVNRADGFSFAENTPDNISKAISFDTELCNTPSPERLKEIISQFEQI